MASSIQFFSARLERELLRLPPGLLARFLHCAERMAEFGPDLGMPHTRALGHGLFELRLKSTEGIVRVFYCTRPGHEILFLHYFVKQAKRTPRRELETARRRMKEITDA